MPRKTRRRIRRKRVRGTRRVNGTKRVNGTRRVRIYYRGGNRRYNGEGGIFGEENNMFTNAASQVRTGATNLYKQVSTSADNILKNASSLVGFKTNDSQLFPKQAF
jgi:hypothetical protein